LTKKWGAFTQEQKKDGRRDCNETARTQTAKGKVGPRQKSGGSERYLGLSGAKQQKSVVKEVTSKIISGWKQVLKNLAVT